MTAPAAKTKIGSERPSAKFHPPPKFFVLQAMIRAQLHTAGKCSEVFFIIGTRESIVDIGLVVSDHVTVDKFEKSSFLTRPSLAKPRSSIR